MQNLRKPDEVIMKIEFTKSKKKIASIWFISAVILFTLFLFQSLLGKFEDKSQQAWGWFLASLMPNLTLMISVFVKDITISEIDKSEVDIFYVRLTMGLSLAYLTSILLILLVQPLTAKPIIQIMNESSIFLGPFQGLVSGSIGLFFLKKSDG